MKNIRFVSSVILRNLSFFQPVFVSKLSNHIYKNPERIDISFMNVLYDEKSISRKSKKDFPKPISIHKHFAYTVHFNDGRKSMGKNNENKQCSKKTFFPFT